MKFKSTAFSLMLGIAPLKQEERHHSLGQFHSLSTCSYSESHDKHITPRTQTLLPPLDWAIVFFQICVSVAKWQLQKEALSKLPEKNARSFL